ncbi:hypothetical protein [Xanthomonas hortorum]|uniref:hypothetical protein n=1 Tax=Xanthomonas hortorum TaxID=56454 RepID=UPI002935A3E6|nr:hypothetical protein [Xanthomonas hortorum]MDV2453665.1 hypothetical protein [Xanthomonas hortorum NBC5720]
MYWYSNDSPRLQRADQATSVDEHQQPVGIAREFRRAATGRALRLAGLITALALASADRSTTGEASLDKFTDEDEVKGTLFIFQLCKLY